MSGGYLKDEGLGPREHQVVIFSFRGEISDEACRAWNSVIRDLKKRLFGNKVMAVTLDGLPTPDDERAYDPKVRVTGLPTKRKSTKRRRRS